MDPHPVLTPPSSPPGPLLGFPVEGVSVCVEELTGDGVALLSACLAQAVQKVRLSQMFGL